MVGAAAWHCYGRKVQWSTLKAAPITGFYGHPDTSMRYSSWELLKTLHSQVALPWVIFEEFNEILHLDEKLGWKDRSSIQMEAFKETLNVCGLYDLGFVR